MGRTPACSKRNIVIDPSPGQAGQPPGEGYFLTGWERTGSVPQAAAVSGPQSFRRFWGMET